MATSRDSALMEITKNVNPTIQPKLANIIKAQFGKIDSLDKLTDWLWICDMEVTKDLILKSFLLKYDQQPYRLDILFYKKINIWYVQDAFINNEIFLDLKNAGRAEKIRPNNLVITY